MRKNSSLPLSPFLLSTLFPPFKFSSPLRDDEALPVRKHRVVPITSPKLEEEEGGGGETKKKGKKEKGKKKKVYHHDSHVIVVMVM